MVDGSWHLLWGLQDQGFVFYTHHHQPGYFYVILQFERDGLFDGGGLWAFCGVWNAAVSDRGHFD